jgi:Rrf2 family protein
MVSRAADYGVRAMLVLFQRPPGSRMTLAELAEECDAPSAYLYKVVRTLATRGLLIAHRGQRGGYELPERARDLSMLDIVRALDGLPALNTCLVEGGCDRAQSCAAHPVWVRAQRAMRDVLAAARLGDCTERGMGHR